MSVVLRTRNNQSFEHSKISDTPPSGAFFFAQGEGVKSNTVERDWPT